MRRLLKGYVIMKLVFIQQMIYRVNFFLTVLSGILSSLIVIFLWLAVYRNASQPVIGGYSIAEMVTYLLGGGLINSFILTTAENPETSQSIQDGSLSSLLIQPIHPYGYWFFRDLGTKLFYLFLGLGGYGVVFLWLRHSIILYGDGGRLSLFLVSLVMAAFLQFLLFEGLSLLAFWLDATYGIRFTMRVIMEVTGGAIIPLSFPSPTSSIFRCESIWERFRPKRLLRGLSRRACGSWGLPSST